MLLLEHSLGHCLSHFPLHLVSPFFPFSFSEHSHCLPRCMSHCFYFPFSFPSFCHQLSSSLLRHHSHPLSIFFSHSPTHLQIVRLSASGHIHSIKARVLLLLLPLIMKALRLACCQAVSGTIINRRHPSSPSPTITGLITII